MGKRKGEQRHISYKLEQKGMKLVCTHIVVCTCVCTRRTEVNAVCLSQLSPTSKLIIILIYLFIYLFSNAHVEVRGQIVGISSLMQCGWWGLNSGCQAWWQAPLPVEPFCRPLPCEPMCHELGKAGSLMSYMHPISSSLPHSSELFTDTQQTRVLCRS